MRERVCVCVSTNNQWLIVVVAKIHLPDDHAVKPTRSRETKRQSRVSIFLVLKIGDNEIQELTSEHNRGFRE